MQQLKDYTIGFVGAGSLARALISGLLKHGFPNEQVIVSNRSQEKLLTFTKELQIIPAVSNSDVAGKGDILVIAVRPQEVRAVIEEICAAVVTKNPLIISLAVGIRAEVLEKWFGYSGLSIVRTMPNTATSVGKGITVLFCNNYVTSQQRQMVESFFQAVGIIKWMKSESEIDRHTPLTGSGIAYLLLIVQAMEQAAVGQGINPKTARELTLQTIYGAITMAQETGLSPLELEKQVATPGGVTAPSLVLLRKSGFFETMADAFRLVEEGCLKLGERLSNDKAKGTKEESGLRAKL